MENDGEDGKNIDIRGWVGRRNVTTCMNVKCPTFVLKLYVCYKLCGD